MPGWDAGLKHFLTYWFSGLVNGLERVDPKSREVIFRECGKACARSYTGEVFQEVKRRAPDIDTFLAHLTTRFPEAVYERVGPHSLRVNYARCECDLVKCGLIESPMLCECSAYNLQENFERSLGVPVSVTIETSILRGDDRCVLLVSLRE
jgi:hypothetical protein